MLSLADGLIAANPEERADLIWRFGTPTEKVCTIPPGVDLDHFQPRDKAAARARLGLAPDDRVVLFVGRIDPIKGIDTLIEAVHRLVTEGVAVLVVEQNLYAATQMAERVLVMVAGRIELETTATALLDDPVLQRRYLGVDTIEEATQ